jgi:hypothetical protein
VEVGRSYEVTRIEDAILREFLQANDIDEDVVLRILARSSYGDVLVELNGTRIDLASETAQQVSVRESL